MVFSKTTSSVIGEACACLQGQSEESNVHLTFRNYLLAVKRKSLRKGVWFKALSRIERGIVDLTVRCVVRIRSPVLIQVLLGVLHKLLEAVKHPFMWRVEQIGRPLAEQMSEAALSWNLKEAVRWRNDVSFIRCLGLNYLSWKMWG